MRRGTVRYTSSRWRPVVEWLRRGGFRMVRLDAVGWLALVGPGALVGVAAWGLLVGTWWPGSLLGAPVGAVFAWVVALTVDARHHARSPVGFQLGEHVGDDEAAEVVDRLRARGLDVRLEPTVTSGPVPQGVRGPTVVGTQRDASAISAALDDMST